MVVLSLKLSDIKTNGSRVLVSYGSVVADAKTSCVDDDLRAPIVSVPGIFEFSRGDGVVVSMLASGTSVPRFLDSVPSDLVSGVPVRCIAGECVVSLMTSGPFVDLLSFVSVPFDFSPVVSVRCVTGGLGVVSMISSSPFVRRSFVSVPFDLVSGVPVRCIAGECVVSIISNGTFVPWPLISLPFDLVPVVPV